MSLIPDLSALDDLPEKTDQMLATLDRLDKLLCILVEIQVGAHSSSAGEAEAILETLCARYGLEI